MSTEWWNYNVARGGLATLDPLQIVPFLFNPKQVEATAQANYARRSAISSTYQRLHYQGTSNWQFPLDLYADTRLMAARSFDGSGGFSQRHANEIATDFKHYERFLFSLLYPRGQQNDPLRRAPPTVVLSWPGLIYMKVKLMTLRFKWTAFNVRAGPVAMSASCMFEEVRNYRLTNDRAKIQGFMAPTKTADRVYF